MNYFTAASYENMERVGEPYYNEKEKLVTRVKCHAQDAAVQASSYQE